MMQVWLETSNEALEDLMISKAYKNVKSIFSKSNVNTLSLHQDEDQAIELKTGKTPLFGYFFKFFKCQLKDLSEYVDENFATRLICLSKFLKAAPELFTPKPDGTLRLCVDHRRLNTITIKNCYFLL